MESLDDHTALVTGANRGIGLAVAATLAQRGARLVMAGRQIEALEEARETLHGQGIRRDSCALLTLDLSRSEEVDRVVAECGDPLDTVDILVNNAGMMLPAGRFLDRNWSTWQEMLQINFTAPARLCHALAPQMWPGVGEELSTWRRSPGWVEHNEPWNTARPKLPSLV